MNKAFPILLTLAALLSVTACGSYLSETCGRAMAVATQLQSILADAQRARADLDKSGIRDKLPPAQRALYDKALGMADEGYRLAIETLATITDACNPPDVRKGIDLIIKAWDILVPILGLIGGEGTPKVQPPTVWSHAHTAGGTS